MQKEKGKGIYFGDCQRKHTYDFEWYLGKNIGVKNNPSTEAESFVRGFLVRDDKLIITNSKKYPKIARESDKTFGRMYGTDSGLEEISKLIKLLTTQKTSYAFISSEHEDGMCGSILTFSLSAPPSELYNSGKIMPVEIYME